MFGVRRRFELAFLLLISASTGMAEDISSAELAWTRMQAEGFPLAGEYVLVSERRAGAGPSEGTSPERSRSVSFGPALNWLDGEVCASWWPTPFKGIPFDLHDPNLSDLIVAPLGDRPNHRLSLLYRISCNGADLAWLLVIDKRIAVVPNADGTRFAILARPLTGSLISRVQEGLAKAGLYDGSTQGQFDERTKSAVAKYVEQRGAAYRFADPAMTMNLLDGLGALDEASGETPVRAR